MRLLCLLLMGNSIQAQKKEYPEYLRITGHCWLIFSVEGVILECIWWERKKGRGGGTVEFGRGPYHDLTSSHTIGPFSCCVFQRTYWTLRNLDTYNIGLHSGLHPHRVHSTSYNSPGSTRNFAIITLTFFTLHIIAISFPLPKFFLYSVRATSARSSTLI